MKIRETAHCIIDPVRGIDVPHRIVKIRKYLLDEERSNNTITLSNEPRKITDMINQMQENVTELTQDGYKKETTIRNNSESIELIAKGLGEAQLKLQEDQIVALISKAINNGNSMQTMQVIIDILGLTIKNGGIKVYDGNNSLVLYVDQNTKKLNFSGTISGTTITGTLFDGGTIRTNDGDIGGWSINSNGLYNGTVKIKNSGITNIYTWADLYIIRLIIMGTVDADDDMVYHYDFNGDGKITPADYAMLKNRLKAM